MADADADAGELLPAEKEKGKVRRKGSLVIEGYTVEGLSIGGQETCVIFPTLKLAFDIGRCPPQAVAQDFLFISHAHLDHMGGLPMYVASRRLYCMKPPIIFVPPDIKENVAKLFEVHRAMCQSKLRHELVALGVGEEFHLRKDLIVKAFRTYHIIPSQGYIVYSVKRKLKEEFVGLPGPEYKRLRESGVEITNAVTCPEIAFTGDTTSDFITDPNNADALQAKIIVLESTFIDDSVTIQHARDFGHTHIFEIADHAEKFQNKAILLIHFSARFQASDIQRAVSSLPPVLAGRVYALTEGFD